MATVGLATAAALGRGGNPSLALTGSLRQLYVGRRTGLLHITRGGHRVSLRFVNGEVVSGSSSAESGRLGETMVRCGLLAREQLDCALAIVNGQGRRLGPVLRELGIMGTARIEEGLGLHIRQLLLTALAWDDAELAFEDAELPEPPPEDITLRCSTGVLILEVVRNISGRERVRAALGDLDRVLVAVPDPPFRLEKITLTPADGYVLSRVDGRASAATIIGITPLPAEDVERSLLGLLCTGVIAFRSRTAAPARVQRRVAPGPEATRRPALVPGGDRGALRRTLEQTCERLTAKNHFEVLGLGPGASETEIREAYMRLVKRLHPDALPGCPPDLKPRLEAVFTRICEAYRVLRAPEKRARYEATLRGASRADTPRSPLAFAPPVRAAAPSTPATTPGPGAAEESPSPAQALGLAEGHLTGGRYWEAIPLLEEIVTRSRGIVEQRARRLLARAYLNRPEWARKAEAQLIALTRLDPTDADALFTLGRFYKDRALVARACVLFDRVVELRPGHKAALAELGALRPAAGAERFLTRLRRLPA